jgi:hypothetical protein
MPIFQMKRIRLETGYETSEVVESDSEVRQQYPEPRFFKLSTQYLFPCSRLDLCYLS